MNLKMYLFLNYFIVTAVFYVPQLHTLFSVSSGYDYLCLDWSWLAGQFQNQFENEVDLWLQTQLQIKKEE